MLFSEVIEAVLLPSLQQLEVLDFLEVLTEDKF